MLTLDYSKSSAEIPFCRILGLTVAERAVLSAQSAGLAAVSIAVAREAETALRSVLGAQPKIRIDVTYRNTPAAENDDIVIPGHMIITDAAMKGLMARTWTIDSLPSGHAVSLSGQNIRAAEDMLLRALIKTADGVISRNINRRISLFISRRIARLPVHPNHITAVVFLVGAASGLFAFFMNSYWGFLAGGLCYYVSAILDGCDGEISRLKYLGSPLGAWLDTVVDDLVGLSYILGLYARFALDRGGIWMWIGPSTIALYLITLLPRYWVLSKMGSGDFQKLAALKKPREIKGIGRVLEGVRNVIFRTDFIPFYAFVTAATGYLLAFAVPFSLGTLASAVDSIGDTVRVKKYLKLKSGT